MKLLIFTAILVVFSLTCGGIMYAIEHSVAKSRNDATCTVAKSYWHSLDLVNSITTAIGYGHILPCSGYGRLFTLIVTLIGIPLMLVVLDLIGKTMMTMMNSAWDYVGAKRKRMVKPKGTDKSSGGTVPVTLGILLTICWMVVTALYFSLLEQWPFLEALYFSIISVTTVGLGDTTSIEKYTIISYFFLYIGLALMSMCINITQQKFTETFIKANKRIEEKFRRRLAVDGKPEGNPEWQLTKILREQRDVFSSFLTDKQRQLLLEAVEKRDKLVNAGVQAGSGTVGIVVDAVNQTEAPAVTIIKHDDGTVVTPLDADYHQIERKKYIHKQKRSDESEVK